MASVRASSMRPPMSNETEIARLAEFGKDWQDPSGGTERGLTAGEITTYMNANFERAKGKRRWYRPDADGWRMAGSAEHHGQGRRRARYLSVAEVRTLFVDRRLPERIVARLTARPASAQHAFACSAKSRSVAAALWPRWRSWRSRSFPTRLQKILPPLAQVLPPPLPDLAPIKEAHWLDQNWSTEDRHWFHHASQGTATFPVPYAWFVALEQPGIHLFTRPGLLKDSNYLERFGFLPSPKTIHTDEATLRRFGYSNASDAKTEPAPASVAGLKPTPVENFDGLPVGFARLTGALDPITGQPQTRHDRADLRGLSHRTYQLQGRQRALRRRPGDGRPAEARRGDRPCPLPTRCKYRSVSNASPTRVLGPDATRAERDELKKGLSEAGDVVLDQANALKKTLKDTHQEDTEEGYGRLDALNRIGNQVFATDLALSGVTGFDKNLEARDAPVSFPPIWTVPWFLWAQYDASIEQPLIRNAGEALGVSALVNLSPDAPKEALFRSSMALENLVRIEDMLRGPESLQPKSKGFRRAAGAEMAVADLPRRSRMEDRSGARIEGPRDLRRDLRRVPPRTGQ